MIGEMIDFISLNKIDADTMRLASKVNAHTLRCEECREKVRALSGIYEELEGQGQKQRLRSLVKELGFFEKEEPLGVKQKTETDR